MDFITFSSIISAFSVMDYLDDREKLERERLHEYRGCYESLGDEIAAMSGTILETLGSTDRYDLEEPIVRGTKQLPLRLFKEILKIQGKPLSRYQAGLIDIYFRNIDDIGYDKDAFFRSVYENDVPGCDRCSSPEDFPTDLAELLASADPGEDVIKSIYGMMAEILARFGCLGECPSDRIVMVFDNIRAEFAVSMSACLSRKKKVAKKEKRAEKKAKLVTKAYEAMKAACRTIRDGGDEEDDIITDLLDFFAVSLATGILMKSTCPMDDKAELLGSLFDDIGFDSPMEPQEIFDRIRHDEQVKDAFYSMANEWESPNYWVVLFTAATRHGLEHESMIFMEKALIFIDTAGQYFTEMMPDAVAAYEVDEYRDRLLMDIDGFFKSIME